MVGAAVLELGGGNVQNALPRPGGDDVHKAKQVLTAVPEAHAAAGAALVVAGRAAHVEGDHALILVPEVHHAVQLFLAGLQPVAGQQALPVVGQRSTGSIHLCIVGVAGHHGVGAGLIDDAGGGELFLLRVLDVAQTEEDLLFLPGGKVDMDMQRTYRCPAVGDAAAAVPGTDGLRVCRAAVHTAKSIPGGVKAGDGGVGPEHRIVVAALPVLGLVVDGTRLHLHLAGGEVALEVGAIVHSVPQAELHIAEHVQLPGTITAVGQGQAVQLTGIALGHEQLLRGADAVLFTLQNGVAQPVAAAVAVQRRLGGLPAGVPDRAAILDVDVVAVHVQRRAVVAVAGQAAQSGVPVKAVAACRVGDQTKKVFTAKVVDPRQRGLWGGDDIFPACVIKMAESHKCFLLISGRDSRLHRFAKTIKSSGRSILFAFSIAEAAQKSKGSRKKISGNSVLKPAYIHLFCAVLFSFSRCLRETKLSEPPFRSNNIGSETHSENVIHFHRNVTKSIRNAQFCFSENGQNAKYA